MRRLASLTLLLLFLGACGLTTVSAPPQQAVSWSDSERQQITRLSPLPAPPIDETMGIEESAELRQLGHYLFFDGALSDDGRKSCAFCHNPELGFADAQVLGQGAARLDRHTPSIWNVAYQRWQYWDGRADTLWMQALSPIENPKEMASSRTAVARRIASELELLKAYESLFGPYPAVLRQAKLPQQARPGSSDTDPHVIAWQQLAPRVRAAVDGVFVNVGKAIAAYERQIISNHSPFDRFVAGDETALTDSAQRGLRVFIGKGKCLDCHSGPNFSDSEFHATGIPDLSPGAVRDPGRYRGLELLVANEFNSRGTHSAAPDGERARRLAATPRTPDLFAAFKTPTLRNVAKTPPYMHNGVFRDLTAVVHFYSTLEGQRIDHHGESVLKPLKLTAAERIDLEAFLRSLSDTSLSPALLRAPTSPLLRPAG